jgi:hypothetical protein
VRRPSSQEIRYHLAVALNTTGHTDEARFELKPLMSANGDFAGVQEARKPWLQLSGQ